MNTKTTLSKVSWLQLNQRRATRTATLLLLLTLALPAAVQAQFNYTINNGTITITGYTGPGGVVAIPDRINGLPVTTIGDSVFTTCTLTGVTIPNSVTNIAFQAFVACYSLTNVTIPNSVISIGAYAFSSCISLTNVTIGNGVTSIGDLAFCDCIRLTDVAIPNSVTNLGRNVFQNCISLTGLTVDAFNPTYSSADGVLFNKNQTTLVEYSYAEGGGYTIPTSVTSIGKYAFTGCTNLTSVTIPDSVTSIGDYAFDDCWSLTSVTIPDSVTNVADGAFAWCTSLTSATIGHSVTWIGDYGLADCPILMGVYFKGNAPSLGSDVFYLDTSATVYYLPGTTGWSTTFGGLLTAVWQSPPPGAWTLSASTITTTGATLNGMVNPYGSLTAAWFQWGTTTNYGNLTAATGMGSGTNALPLSASLAGLIPGVTYHFRIAATNDYGLVYGSDQSFTTWGLPQVSTLPATGVSTNSATLNAMVNPYGFLTAAWFQWGTTTDYGNLTAVTGMGSGTNALPLSASLAGLTPGVTYHYRVAATNSNGAGYSSDGTFNTLGPPEVWTLSATAVTATNALLNGTVNPNGYPATAWFQWGNTTSYGNLTAATDMGSGTSDLPLSVALAGLTVGATYHFRVAATNSYGTVYGSDQSFSTATLPTEFNYTINNGTITITGYTGSGGDVVIPSTINGLAVTSIGDSALYNCARLTSVMIPNSVTSIGVDAFSGCRSLTSVTIPNSVTNIGDQAFNSCVSLASVTIGNGVTHIGYVPFESCSSLKAIAVDASNPAYSSLSGVLFNKSQTVLVEYPGGIEGSYTIPNSAISIGVSAFAKCCSLSSVTIGTGVTSIGDYAFDGCTSLINVTIPDSVISIGGEAFSECSSLTNVTIPDSVISIGGEAFSECSSLTYVTIPNSVTSIGAAAFVGCSSLTNVTVPSSVTNIADYTFQWCTDLSSVTIGSGVTSIGGAAFQGCTSLTSITIPNSVTNIGDYAFYGCTSLTSITIPNRVTNVGEWAFASCTSLTSVTIPDSVTSIANDVFYYCTELTSITIPDSVTSIGVEAFRDCGLTNVTIGDSVSDIGGGAFFGCASLINVTIPDSVTDIGAYAFSGCTNLTSVTIPNSVTNIGDGAFSACLSLEAVRFLGNAPLLGGSGVFYGDNDATVYYLPGTTGWGSTFGGLPTALWQPPPPKAWTLSASTITTTSATLNGTVNPNSSLTAAWFQWGTSTNYGNLTASTGMGSGTNALPLSAPLVGLTPGVTYHYRVAATNSNGAAYSSDGSFTTLGPPEVWTLSATAVTATNATLNGTVNPRGYPTGAWFQWGTTTSYGNLTAATDMGGGTGDLPLSVALAGLTLGATYHFRVAATNSCGTVYGSDQRFTARSFPVTDADWVSLGSGMSGEVRALVMGGTTLYAGGKFTTAGGVPANNMAEWNGNAWSALDLGLWYASEVWALAVSGANFYAGTANVFKWVGGGWVDVGWTGGVNPEIRALAVSGNILYAGGSFSSLAGASVTDIAKWDGMNWSALGLGMTDEVLVLAVSGPNIYAGGYFTNAGGVPANGIAKWNGSAWSALGSGVTGGARALAVSGTVLYAGGYFTNAGGVPANCIAKWDGSAWSALGSGLNGVAYALAVDGTDLYAGGDFTEAGGVPANHIAKWDGSSWSALGSGLDGPVYALAADGAGHLFVGGGFTHAGTNACAFIAQANVGSIPTILRRPQAQSAETGAAVSLVVDAASELPLAYQWFLNGTNILSCTSSCLELTNLLFSDSGLYTVVVSNSFGAVTSAPVAVNVIPAVERRPVPGAQLMGGAGNVVNLDYADLLKPVPTWTLLGSVSLASTSQYYFDLTLPLPPQRFYRAWQTGTPGVRPSLDLHMVPAITLTGSIGGSVRVDAINQFGPIDAWFTLDTVTLTNTSQLYFDTSAWQQPQRLYRLVQVP